MLLTPRGASAAKDCSPSKELKQSVLIMAGGIFIRACGLPKRQLQSRETSVESKHDKFSTHQIIPHQAASMSDTAPPCFKTLSQE
jgi:hypothetical protein